MFSEMVWNGVFILVLAVCVAVNAGAEALPDLTVVPKDFRETVCRSRDWARRTNPLFDLNAEGVDDIHLAYVGETLPVIVLSNRTTRVLPLRGRIRVVGFGGMSFSLDATSTLPPHGCRRFPCGGDLSKGTWLVEAALETDAAKATAETRFAVVRRRVVTPLAETGVFRAGFNYHMSRYSQSDNAKCLKALVQAGAKIVRAGIDAGFSSIRKKPNEFDWTKSDGYLAQLERSGLALDTIIYSSPEWAVDDKHKEGMFWQSPLKRGLFREFCEKLSARYGTRIAWYEIGNEWDLLQPEQMTTDEAIELQREGYEGLKAGCRNVSVIPNGWAVVHSDVIPHRTQRNMQERLMSEARESYDAHPVHQHGSYREYRRRLPEFFAWRKARGIDFKPWYSNETALTETGAGEERVAECVWQKILYARVHGSVDYIWYNLRAWGLGPFDGEQGYGVLTGDFYPRTSFAAFAGLTSCFEGLTPQGIVYQGSNRDVFRFAGHREGMDVQVFVGWDLKATTNVPVCVKTDAQRAFEVDLFDNRRAVTLENGVVRWNLGKTPSALLLESVSTAVPDKDALACGDVGTVKDVELGESGYRFNLDDFDCVFEMYKADPLNLDRVWGGWWDLGGSVSLQCKNDMLQIVADIRDERQAAEDALMVIVDGAERRFQPEKPLERGLRYVAQVAFPKPESVLEIRIEDDDGKGKEGWVTTGPFRIVRSAVDGQSCRAGN